MSPTEILRYKNMESFGFGPIIMKKTKLCTKCGRTVKATAKVCPECSKKLPQETLFDRYKKLHTCCPECDTVLATGSLYCPNCGRQILPKVAGYDKGGG